MKPNRQAAIAARAHQIWEESGHAHGQDEKHWRQAEREHDEAGVRAAAVEEFRAEAPVAKPARKRVAKAIEPAAEVPAAPARKSRAPRKTSAGAGMN